MIFDKISNLEKYAAFDARFSEAAEFISSHDMVNLEDGRYDLSDGMFVNISSYEPNPIEKAGWEAHRQYADLQCLFSGDEVIIWAPIDTMTGAGDFFPDVDFQGFADSPEKTELRVYGGTFAYFAPQDVHMPGIKLSDGNVKKAVFKIPV